MTDFQQDEEVTPVLFRVHRSPVKYGPEVTAVFPAEPFDTRGHYMSCYARVGQHGSCSLEWYWKTRPARPEEYASLKRELESAPFGYRLKVYQKMTPQHREAFRKEVNRMHRAYQESE